MLFLVTVLEAFIKYGERLKKKKVRLVHVRLIPFNQMLRFKSFSCFCFVFLTLVDVRENRYS